jgi:hypothetical protein
VFFGVAVFTKLKVLPVQNASGSIDPNVRVVEGEAGTTAILSAWIQLHIIGRVKVFLGAEERCLVMFDTRFNTGDALYAIATRGETDGINMRMDHFGWSELRTAPRTISWTLDLVFNRTSETQDEVGLSSVYLDDDTVVFGGFVIRGRPTCDFLDATYSGYALRAPPIRRQVIAKGQGAIRSNIGQADLRQVFAPLPPIPEQRAIAAALSDVDALIDALDQLIAKKRDLKQAAMQQFLTGQKRLPGFHGEWEVKRLRT